MQAHTVERVESWDSRPFSGGFRELHDLADREFSGAVVADETWLFMLNGRVVGVFEGDVEDFGAASGTVYDAPHQSLPLLFSMQERGGETQAKYYTNDTPISEADETLSDASFTGYVELSENVLSGDYYVVYYGGRSMSAAFVGASEELVTGEDAFERADDEVGVYEVKKAPVNVTSLPDIEDEPDGTSAAGATAGAAASAGDAGADDAAADPTDEADSGAEPADAQSQAESEPAEPSAAADSSGSTEASAGTSTEASAGTGTAGASDAVEHDDAEPDDAQAESGSKAGRPEDATAEPASGDEPAASDRDEQSTGQRESRDARADASAAAAASTDESDDGTTQDDDAAAAASEDGQEGVFDEEAEWRNARSVPTLDPEKSESTDGGAAPAKSSKQGKRAQSRSQSGSSSQSSRSQSGGKPRSTVEKLKRAVKQRNEKLEQAAGRIDDLEDERDELRERVASLQDEREEVEAERDALREERDELRARAEELEAELEATGGSDAAGETDLSPAEAFSGTNLFVRYDSKGQPTLDELGADTDPAAVNENLRIEHHTQFDAADATVDGEDFESFLESSAAYRFVSWAVRELPFEIRDTGHTDSLGDLYGALPDVDRAELDGTVAVDTEEGSTSRTFDVVLRDRMGDPLVVAELNSEREPVTGDEMDELVGDATAVRKGADELCAAMYVTASFFEPAALETAAEETGGGGFLSRSDRASFVKVGRKAGYHLCLVEDRDDAFHVTVPEL